MSPEQMLKMATCFTVDEGITIEKRGDDIWCVSVFGSVLDKDLNRHFEPPPIYQSDEFKSKTRFSLNDAFDLAFKYKDV